MKRGACTSVPLSISSCESKGEDYEAWRRIHGTRHLVNERLKETFNLAISMLVKQFSCSYGKLRKPVRYLRVGNVFGTNQYSSPRHLFLGQFGRASFY